MRGSLDYKMKLLPQLHAPISRMSNLQATLESQAVLDTVACDVDLGLCTSIWPPGHTPSSKGPYAPVRALTWHA